MTGKFVEALPEPGASAKKPVKRTGEETFGRLMLAIAAVLLAARLVGAVIARLSQPRVMGEVLAGILLGPTLLGAVWPEAKDYLFPPDIVPLLSGAAQIGLAFYLFLVGMELDPRFLRERIGQAAFISNTSVAFPMALGFLVAMPIYKLLSPDVRYLPFALFMGVAMSVTAFPVLARILIERRMLKRPVGALSMAGAAIDDVTAWGLLALATAVAGTRPGVARAAGDRPGCPLHRGDAPDRPPAAGPALEGLRRGRPRSRSSGSASSSSASCSPPTSRSRSGSPRSSARSSWG